MKITTCLLVLINQQRELGKTSKKINRKKNDIVQKGGEVSEKNQILKV